MSVSMITRCCSVAAIGLPSSVDGTPSSGGETAENALDFAPVEDAERRGAQLPARRELERPRARRLVVRRVEDRDHVVRADRPVEILELAPEPLDRRRERPH